MSSPALFFCISWFEKQLMWYTNSLPALLSWTFLSNIIPKIQTYERFSRYFITYSFKEIIMRLILLCIIRLDFPLIIHRWYFLYDKVRKTNNSVFDFLPQSINFYSSIIMENMIHSFFLPLRMLIYMCICFTCYCLAYQAWRIGIRISPSSIH